MIDYVGVHLYWKFQISWVANVKKTEGKMMQVASSSSATTPLGGHAPKKMGLLPLEFADCLIDSPYFRENLKSHEKQLDQTSADIKGIIRDIQVRKI